MAPTNNRGVTYQTDEKHLGKIIAHLVGVVKIAFTCLNNRFLLRVINR